MNNNVELPKLVDKESAPIVETKKANPNYKETWHDMFKYITSCKGKELAYVVLRVLLIVILIILFKLPFDLLRDLVINLFPVFGITISEWLLNAWYAICNILYSIFGIIAFYKIVKERYYNLIKKQLK